MNISQPASLVQTEKRSISAHPSPVTAFFSLLYGTQAGWCELVTGEIDPTDPRRLVNRRRRWLRYTPAQPYTLRTLEQAVHDGARRAGNVYVGVCLYAKPERRPELAIPGRLVVVDDAPAESPWPAAMQVQTSTWKYHTYFQVDDRLSPADYTDLARRAAAALHGDPSGADLTQLVRVPCSFNTKRGGRWPVELTSYDPDMSYPLADLHAAWPAQRAAHVCAQTSTWSTPDGATLVRSKRFAALCSANAQLATVIAGGRVSVAGDTTVSAQRAVFVHQLARAQYPPDEIRALALHFFEVLSGSRAPAHYQQDIDRLISKEGSYAVQPTKFGPTISQEAPGQTKRTEVEGLHTQTTPGGRPAKLTPESLMQFFELECSARPGGLIVSMTRQDVADRFGVSYGTVTRCEQRLIATGQCTRLLSPDRQSSYIRLGTSDQNPPANDTPAGTSDQNPIPRLVKTPVPQPDAYAPVTLDAMHNAGGIDHDLEITHPPCVLSESVPVSAWPASSAHRQVYTGPDRGPTEARPRPEHVRSRLTNPAPARPAPVTYLPRPLAGLRPPANPYKKRRSPQLGMFTRRLEPRRPVESNGVRPSQRAGVLLLEPERTPVESWLAGLRPWQQQRIAECIAAGDLAWLACRMPDEFDLAEVVSTVRAQMGKSQQL